jgi:hypothetical protein
MDPAVCVDFCTTKYEQVKKAWLEDQALVIVAVSEAQCGCVVDDMTQFVEVEKEYCNVNCPNYQNQLCGGESTSTAMAFWNVFIEYDYLSFGSMGAYDPWRYIWYSIVIVKQNTIAVNLGGASVHPERYYLHAVNEEGIPIFPNQMELKHSQNNAELILYGITFDLNDSRIIGLALHKFVGRIEVRGGYFFQKYFALSGWLYTNSWGGLR